MSVRRIVLSALLGTVLGSASLHAQGPVLSEIMARNASAHRDPTHQFLPDWIELHNPTAVAIQLAGMYLTDDALNLRKWQIPTRSIAAGGFEVIYASGRNLRVQGQPLHTSFQLDGDGEFLALVDRDGVTILDVYVPQYPKQYPDLSFGRAGNTGSLGYFEVPSPGAGNGATPFVAVAGKVTADQPRGSYSAPIAVTLASPSAGATIRYTTDGSKPTRTHGTVYSGPIAVAKSTVLRAVAFTATLATSKAATFSYLFFQDVFTQSATQPGYPTEWGKFNSPRGRITRPSDYGMDPTITQDPVYRPMLLESLESLPVVSLVADIDDLFDEQTGIYVNPQGRTEVWERPASVEFLYPKMGRSQQSDVGLRIAGARSRMGAVNGKHSFRLLFKENYGARDLDANLFGAAAAQEHNTIVLRSIYSDGFTGTLPLLRETAIYVRDMFVRDSFKAMGRVTPSGSFCHLFVNGLYWGLFNPSERPDAAFQVEYRGGTREEWDVLKHFDGTIVDGNRTAYDAAKAIALGGLSSAAAYANIQSYIDVENLADYMVLNLFCATDDWPANNWYMARRRVAGATFKFYPWDAETALFNLFIDRTRVSHTDGPALFYDKLRANAEFRLLMADRAHRMLGNEGPMSLANCLARFRRRMSEVRMAVVAESARWGDYLKRPPYTLLGDWEPDTRHELNVFFPGREVIFLAQMKAAGLYPNVDPPGILPYGGTLQPSANVTMTSPGTTTGTIYFTTDGSDPRLPGGNVSGTARVYTTAVSITTDSIVKARVRDGGVWSALTAATFRRPNLTINEALASNSTGLQDPAGEHEDWFEIINPTDRAIQAGGMYVTDDLRAPTKWQIPAGQVLQPGATLLVWADNDLQQPGVHAAFKLSAGGESLFLIDRDGKTQISGFHFGQQVTDVSIGWLRDGGPDGRLVTFPVPTPGASNEIACGTRRYNSRAQDQHPIELRGLGSGRLGTSLTLDLQNGSANQTHLLFYSRTAGYWNVLAPSTEVSYLLGPVAGQLLLQTNGAGQVQVPLFVAYDTNLIGVRFYFQAFGFPGRDVRGSNALELVICR